MTVQHINDDGQFEQAMQNANNSQLIICDFFAHWCGPCRYIAPIFEQLSDKYPDVLFLKIDVDRCRLVCQLYGIRAMPTFLAIVNRQELGRISGADPNALERLIIANLRSTTSSSASKKSNIVATQEERSWLERIVENSKKVERYEDEIAQTLALSLISADDLRAQSKVDGVVNQYELAKKLMNWFHDLFFQWVDQPKCDRCQSSTNHVQTTTPSMEEQDDSAGRVEIYRCTNCNLECRFPRYQNPIKLLETRRGRCGEWANCFALFCRAIGLDTRWVTDNNDHVWVEIWSDDLDRWVHVDPCENVIDTPLMYEKGWGKKYSYVFAFGIDHVRDVTWRYCYNHKAAIARRTACREAVLRNFLNKLNARLSKNLSKERQDRLTISYMKELVEFLFPKLQLRDGSEAENQGRKSGNEEWRQKRGEGGLSAKNIIKPTEDELKAKCIIITYDCATDMYSRPNESSQKINGWKSLCYESNNVFRKVENDWKICYICRKANSPTGFITWKIDLSNTKVKKAEVNLGELTAFKTGQITASVCCGDSCCLVPQETGSVTLDVENAEYLELRVDFAGGEGDCAWQHAQLFRGSSDNPQDSMTIKIYLE